MAAVWGYAEIETHIDGSALPREVAQEAQAAARTGGKAFTTQIKKEMRGGAREAARDFGRSFSRFVTEAFRTSGLAGSLRRGFRLIGLEAKQTGQFLLNGIVAPVRRVGQEFADLGRLIRTDSIKTMNELREGASHLGISFKDLRDTFPLVERGIRGIGTGFRAVRSGIRAVGDEARGFAQILRDDSIKTMDELGEGSKRLKINLKDIEETFPPLFRAARATGRAFRFIGTEIKSLGPDMEVVRDRASTLADRWRGLVRTVQTHIGVNRGFRDGLADTSRELKIGADAVKLFDKSTKDSDISLGNWGLGLGKLTKSMDSNNGSSKSLLSTWKRMPHGLRQVLLWTTVILAAFEQLSVLASAAGGGLFILLGAATQFGIGLGATIAVFKDLNSELSELPESIRPAAAAFQGIGDAFGELQDHIQGIALQNAVGAFESLANTVRSLKDAFTPLAEVIGANIQKFADGIAPGTAAFADLDTLIRNSAPTFDHILEVLGKLGGALLDAFANPTMQKAIEGLVNWLEELVDTFADFVASDDFVKWIENSMDVLDSFGDLLGGVGDVLNGLVDDAAVKRTTDFLDALTQSLPFVESLLSTIGALNVFGVLAQAIAALTPLLAPLLQLLEPIGRVISDLIVVGLKNLEFWFNVLSVAMIPVRLAFEAFEALWGAFMDWLAPVTDAIGEVGQAFQDTGNEIVEGFIPAFEDIAGAIFAALPSPEEFARFLREDLIPKIKEFGDWVVNHAVPALEDFADFIRTDVVPAAQAMYDFFRIYLLPIFSEIGRLVTVAVTAFTIFANGIKSAIDTIRKPIQDAINWFRDLFNMAGQANQKASQTQRAATPMASGGLLFGPRRILAGEAGPEAIVPLRRPLSQVDPSVRALSAIAQGLGRGVTPAMASGGVVGGGGRSLTIDAGAITVVGSADPRRTAIEVVNRIVERAS